ncbi:MAG: NAD(P)H-binding protein [Cyanobacteria bacterium J06592_8]
MSSTVLVTGASGNVGREVLQSLKTQPARIRIASRTPRQSEDRENLSTVYLDFQDPSTYSHAIAQCQSIFLLRPPAIANVKETLNRFIDVAREIGVQQIVFLSVAGADRNRIIPHHAVEQHLQTGSADWTILRPGFFAQNIGTVYRSDIINSDRIYLPAGQGRVAFVDLRDVGKVAAELLLSWKPHQGKAYTLTGPQAFSFEEVAQSLTSVLGRTIEYNSASSLGYIGHLRRQNKPWPQVIVQTLLHVGLRFGQAEAVDPTLEQLLGRKPLDVQDYIADHVQLWHQDLA